MYNIYIYASKSLPERKTLDRPCYQLLSSETLRPLLIPIPIKQKVIWKQMNCEYTRVTAVQLREHLNLFCRSPDLVLQD